jgi:hypothetical protein
MTRPPTFGEGCRRTMTLGAYAKPHTQRYFTKPLSNLSITVVKQMERIDFIPNGTASASPAIREPVQEQSLPDPSTIYSTGIDDPSLGSFAGCGVITVKRNVYGYKKMSLVTLQELSRSELALPDMEYDTFAFWIDCDVPGLGSMMTPNSFSYGIHALSHALCNVAPLFVPCVGNDVQCNHSIHGPTRVIIFDARAGGSGITAQLWKCIFAPKGVVEAALDLLESCPSCSEDRGYTGGCPACIQMGECIKFNEFLCNKSGVIIARHMLQRIQQTDQYKKAAAAAARQSVILASPNMDGQETDDDGDNNNPDFSPQLSSPSRSNNKRPTLQEVSSIASPRRKKRERAMRVAKDIDSARERQMVVGRPSWPTDRTDGPPQQQQGA